MGGPPVRAGRVAGSVSLSLSVRRGVGREVQRPGPLSLSPIYSRPGLAVSVPHHPFWFF